MGAAHRAVCAGIDRVTTLCEAQTVAAQACSVLVGSVEIFSGPVTLYQALPQLASLRCGVA